MPKNEKKRREGKRTSRGKRKGGKEEKGRRRAELEGGAAKGKEERRNVEKR